jgi:predicted metal-dependent phosphotriesterase family hydrolase
MPHGPTVLGPVDVASLGRTLLHEHIFIFTADVQHDQIAGVLVRAPYASSEARSASAPSLDSADCGLLSRYGSLSQQGQEESRKGGRRAP